MSPVYQVSGAASLLIWNCVWTGDFPRSFRIAVFYLFLLHLELDVLSNYVTQNQNTFLCLLHYASWQFWLCNFFNEMKIFCTYDKKIIFSTTKTAVRINSTSILLERPRNTKYYAVWPSMYLVFIVTQSTKKHLTQLLNATRLFRNVYGYLPVNRSEHPQKSSFFSHTAMKFRNLAYCW
jgi:hypothetical protein